MAERVFNGDDKFIRHANAIRERADDGTRLAQRRDRAGVKTFARAFELFEHASGANAFRPAAAKIDPARRRIVCNSVCNSRKRFCRCSTEPRVVATLSFSTSTLAVNSCRRDSSRVRSSSSCTFSAESFSRRIDVALLLQIERGDFVADARQILRGGKRGGLRVRAMIPAVRANHFPPFLQIVALQLQIFLCCASAVSDADNFSVTIASSSCAARKRSSDCEISASALEFCDAISFSRSSLN